jgi:hypothetical protein
MRYKDDGFRVFPRAGAEALVKTVSKIPGAASAGTNVLDQDWDILVILDTCRLDMYREVVNRNAGWIWSVGSQSREWMEHTFDNRDCSSIDYVSANPFTDTLDTSGFRNVHEVWKTGWDEEMNTVPPRPVTDCAIQTYRGEPPSRMIVHYMQPHHPFIGVDMSDDMNVEMDIEFFLEDGNGMDATTPFEKIKQMQFTYEDIRDAYYRNLAVVRKDVELLIDNLDGRLAVTADHGNGNGEWGMWGHKPGMPHPKMRRVPWDIYECTDQKSYVPDTENVEPDAETQDDDIDREERLESLGYL